MARDIEKLSAEKLPKSDEILERAKKVLLSPQATGPFRAPNSVVIPDKRSDHSAFAVITAKAPKATPIIPKTS